MLRKFQYAPCLEEVYRHSATQITSWYRSAAAALSTIRDALIEALAAHRRYEHLMSRGMPHDTALRLATSTHIAGIGPRLRTHHRLRPRGTMPRMTSRMRTTSGEQTDGCLCVPAIPASAALEHPVQLAR
jgi:hypothetical protein